MNKYNEIMNSVTVDPEMKKRIMNSVSAAIKEQGRTGSAGRRQTGSTGSANISRQGSSSGQARRPEVRRVPESARVTDIPKKDSGEQYEAPVRKKAKKTPVIVISTIAAALVIIMGVLFVFRYMNAANKSASGIATHNQSVDLFSKTAAETQADSYFYAEATVAAGDEEAEEDMAKSDDMYSTTVANNEGVNIDSNAKNTLTVDITASLETTAAERDGSEGMGDARIDTISKALPFDLKGSGSGMFSDTISEEVFIGNGGEKVVLYTAPEGTDIYKDVTRAAFEPVSEGTTSDGYVIRYCRYSFGNVADLAEGETSTDVNAAVFTKNGSVYLIVFSDIQPAEVIARVADAV